MTSQSANSLDGVEKLIPSDISWWTSCIMALNVEEFSLKLLLELLRLLLIWESSGVEDGIGDGIESSEGSGSLNRL